MRLELAGFVAEERLPLGQMYVLRRGTLVKLWRFLTAGKVWGEDALLDAKHIDIVDHSQAVALTYVEVLTLSKAAFKETGEFFPVPLQKVNARMHRIVIQRYLLRYLAKRTRNALPRSYISRSAASGVTYVKDGVPPTLEEQMQMEKMAPPERLKPQLYATAPLTSLGTTNATPTELSVDSSGQRAEMNRDAPTPPAVVKQSSTESIADLGDVSPRLEETATDNNQSVISHQHVNTVNETIIPHSAGGMLRMLMQSQSEILQTTQQMRAQLHSVESKLAALQKEVRSTTA
jgi:hypothetical protein